MKEKSKLAERRTKKHRRKGKAFKKEAPPINSTSIRYRALVFVTNNGIMCIS